MVGAATEGCQKRWSENGRICPEDVLQQTHGSPRPFPRRPAQDRLLKVLIALEEVAARQLQSAGPRPQQTFQERDVMALRGAAHPRGHHLV